MEKTTNDHERPKITVKKEKITKELTDAKNH